MDLFVFILACVFIGIGSGFLGGLLGIGGGVVIVPALLLIYAQTGLVAPAQAPFVAVATSLSCIVFPSASAAWSQYRAGRIEWPIIPRFLPALLAGAWLAGYLGPYIPVDLFRIGFAAFITLVGIIMVCAWQPQPRAQLPGLPMSSVLGGGAGIGAGLAGIAGGNIIVPLLTALSVPAHRATATASAMGVPIAALSAVSYFVNAPEHTIPYLIGWIDRRALLPIIAAAVITAPLGVRFAQKVPAQRLKRIFGGLLLMVAVRLLLD